LSSNPALYNAISQHLCATAGERSMDRFLAEIITASTSLYAEGAAIGRRPH
jgi:hypothetical protein